MDIVKSHPKTPVASMRPKNHLENELEALRRIAGQRAETMSEMLPLSPSVSNPIYEARANFEFAPVVPNEGKSKSLNFQNKDLELLEKQCRALKLDTDQSRSIGMIVPAA